MITGNCRKRETGDVYRWDAFGWEGNSQDSQQTGGMRESE